MYGQEIKAINITPTEEVSSFKIYPNPATNNVVYVTANSNTDKNVTVYDVFGKVVLKDRITSNMLNISSLVPGVYVIQLSFDNKRMTRKLVVK